MDFKEATDILFSGTKHEDLAAALGVSIALVRQARLKQSANAHRTAPGEWKKAVIRVAETRAKTYMALIEKLSEISVRAEFGGRDEARG